jgi:short-subunit dehydrogenase
MQAEEFAGATVYVVGGSSGIGLAIARKAAALGADVVLFARRRQILEDAAAQVQSAAASPKQKVVWQQLDVTDAAAVQQVLGRAVADCGPPRVVVNCAGGARPGYFEEITHEQLVDTMRVNLFGCWATVQALLPHMKGQGGYIVNVASMAGLIGVFGYTDYCASKFALVGFSEALRSELKRFRITVSVLCPPDTDTPGLAAENETKPAETRAVSAGAGVMSADAVAQALLRGMRRGSFLIIPGREGKFIALAKRFFPRMVESVMERTVRGVTGRARPGPPEDRA